jgi:hypothetical protein
MWFMLICAVRRVHEASPSCSHDVWCKGVAAGGRDTQQTRRKPAKPYQMIGVRLPALTLEEV